MSSGSESVDEETLNTTKSQANGSKTVAAKATRKSKTKATAKTTAATQGRRVAAVKSEAKFKEEEQDEKEVVVTEPKLETGRKRKAPTAVDNDSAAEHDDDDDDDEEEEEEKKPAKKIKTAIVKKTTTTKTTVVTAKTTKKAKKGEMLPLAGRTAGAKMLLGAHVSAAKGVQNAIKNSLSIGGNSLALFLKSQRKWTSPPLKTADISAFKTAATKAGYDSTRHILPHGSYLVNLAQPDPTKATQAYDCFVDDLKRCEQLDVGLYNFHPGSTLGEPRPEALARISAALNKAHAATSTVKTVLENMAGAGNVIGCAFEDLRDIIAGVTDKSRVGVCIDTCHAFVAGHDIRTKETWEDTMSRFSEIVGLEYLCALHLNDSKAPLGSKRDLHANIGTGYIGLEAFRLLMNDPRLEGLPMVLETPIENEDFSIWADEIKLLEGLVGVKEEDEKFLETCAKLQQRGAAERKRVGEQVDKKKGKAAPKVKKAATTAGKGRGRKKKEDTPPESADEGCDSCSE